MADKSPDKGDGYFGQIFTSARAVLEGMAVTATYLFRKPVTVQYPDRTSIPVVDSLPERYRGFLEVDMDICTACKACERDCPIDCITIDIEKVNDVRSTPTRARCSPRCPSPISRSRSTSPP
jgi:formate hydrogenlyase subunit 6/NADH:ubiquinone oxidoreductase subunit I